MNREIKFEYIVKNLHFNDIEKYVFTLEDIENKGGRTPSWIWSDNAEIITKRQYTGLKDKTGKEIYEEDICRHPDSSIGFIRMDHGWVIEYSKKYSHDMPQYYCDYLEVIGNIYQNPELLEQK